MTVRRRSGFEREVHRTCAGRAVALNWLARGSRMYCDFNNRLSPAQIAPLRPAQGDTPTQLCRSVPVRPLGRFSLLPYAVDRARTLCTVVRATPTSPMTTLGTVLAVVGPSPRGLRPVLRVLVHRPLAVSSTEPLCLHREAGGSARCLGRVQARFNRQPLVGVRRNCVPPEQDAGRTLQSCRSSVVIGFGGLFCV